MPTRNTVADAPLDRMLLAFEGFKTANARFREVGRSVLINAGTVRNWLVNAA